MGLRVTNRAAEKVMSAGFGGQATVTFKVASVGTPDHVLFIDYGLPDMVDDDYVVLVGGETVALVTVDESTIATTGFDILNGGAAEIIHVLVCGKFVGMPAV